jgi:PAS domain S-box-containing protein
MHRVELTGQAETINTTVYIDKNKIWLKNELVKLDQGVVAIFNKQCCLDYSQESRGDQLELELNEAEKLLEHQKKMFQHIMEHSESISVQGYNEKHEVIYWNQASEKLYGYTAMDAYGKKLEDLIIPEFMRQAVHEGVESWLYDGVKPVSSELTLIDKNGEGVNVYSEHIMIEVDTHHTEMYCVDIDLNEIKQLQKELLKQRNFLRTIFDVIPDLIWLQDVEGKYLACNTMFERFIGAKETEIMGKTAFDFLNIKLEFIFFDILNISDLYKFSFFISNILHKLSKSIDTLLYVKSIKLVPQNFLL